MKAVILAGGLGTRISEESHLKPKPMIEIGGKLAACDCVIDVKLCFGAGALDGVWAWRL